MNWKQRLLAVGFLALQLVASAGTLDDKTPDYFVEQYGQPRSSQIVPVNVFMHAKRGSVVVNTRFTVREYRKGDLRVQAVFTMPALRLAAVKFLSVTPWTPQQKEALLATFGGPWRAIHIGSVNYWAAPDGALAITQQAALEIQSRATADLVEKTGAANEAQQKNAPKI